MTLRIRAAQHLGLRSPPAHPPQTLVFGSILWIAAGALGAGCGTGAGSSGGATSSASASAPPPSSAPLASASGALPAAGDTCADASHVARPDGSSVACGADAVCLGGACAPLATPSGPIAPDRVMRASGWLNAWSLFGPFDRGQVDAFAKSPDTLLDASKSGGAKPLCVPDGLLALRARGGGHALLAGYLVSPRAQRVWLKIGVRGKVRAWVGGTKVIDAARPDGLDPMPDELAEKVDVPAGASLVLVDVEGSEDAPPALYVRARDDRQSGQDLGFSLLNGGASGPLRGPAPHTPALAKTACAPEDLVDLKLTRQISAAGTFGFDVDGVARFAGLVPLTAADVAYRAELRAKSPVSLASGAFSFAALTSEDGARVRVHAEPSGKGKQAVRFTLGAATGDDARAVSTSIEPKKKLHSRAVALAATLDKIPAALGPSSRVSFVSHVKEVLRAAAEGHPDDAWLADRIADAEELAAAIAKGEDPYKTKTGVVFRAYESKLDGEPQPYVAFIPPTHKPGGAPMPLIVSFHGLTHRGEHALRAVIGEATKEDQNPEWAARHLPKFPNQGAILVAPWGYGKSGPRHLGEHDVLAVIDEMKAAYAVDAQRVSITGYSLGGTVAFALPLHYPSVFSAAAPLCGYPNLTTYQSVKDVPHKAWEDAMIARRFLGNYAANGRHVPLHIVHGGQDGPARSQVIAERYKALGYPRIFDVQDDLGHNVWDYAYKDGRMVTWLKKKERPAAPTEVRFVTGDYRYDRAHWIRLVRMERMPGEGAAVEKIDTPASFADIEARWATDAREVRITTKNVASLAIDLTALGAPNGTKAVLDGTSIALPKMPDPKATQDAHVEVIFEKQGQTWAIVADGGDAGQAASWKRAGVAGPLDDVLRHPQLIVVGTQDPLQTETNRTVAAHFQSDDQWAAAKFPIKADRDVTEADRKGKSLVLIGNARSNSVLADMIAKLPLTFEPNAIVFRGKRYEGEDVGVSFIFPNPGDPNEYVVVHAGVGFRGTLASRHLPQLAPDFLVYDSRIAVQRGELLLHKRQVLDGGFFDSQWK